MRKVLLAVFCTLCLIAAVDVAAAQQTQTPENKDKSMSEKTADKAKEAGQEVSDKAKGQDGKGCQEDWREDKRSRGRGQ